MWTPSKSLKALHYHYNCVSDFFNGWIDKDTSHLLANEFCLLLSITSNDSKFVRKKTNAFKRKMNRLDYNIKLQLPALVKQRN
jgi:hypothetical protein